MVTNLVIVGLQFIIIYDFIKHGTLLSNDFTCITRHNYVLVLYEWSTDFCETSASVLAKILTHAHKHKYGTTVSNLAMI